MKLQNFLTVLCLSSLAGTVAAQLFPSRPVRIVTTEAGGGTDLVARMIAQNLSAPLGQQVIVDNRGGSVVIPAMVVAQAPPQGYTLLFFANPLWLVPYLQDKVPYDPVKNFAPIILTHRSPNVVAVNPSVPAKSIKELMALAKAKPGELNYASGGMGSSNHLAAELFNAMAGVNITRVLYKGAGPALTELMGGQVQIMFATAGSVLPHVKSGKLRALAVTTAEPSALTPGLPTVSASGLPGYESVAIYGIFGPTGTPAAIITRLNREIAQVLNKPDVKDRLFTSGVEVVASSPEQLGAAVKADMTRMGKVIKDAGIRAD